MKIGLLILLIVAAVALLFATVGMAIGTHAKYGSKAEKISDFLMDVAMGILITCILGVVISCIIVVVSCITAMPNTL